MVLLLIRSTGCGLFRENILPVLELIFHPAPDAVGWTCSRMINKT
jgi:hypothetical protein